MFEMLLERIFKFNQASKDPKEIQTFGQRCCIVVLVMR